MRSLPFLVVLPLALQAGPWQEIGKTGTGNPVYINARGVRTAKDGIISATVRVVYVKKVAVPGQKDSLTASRAHAMFNCVAKSFAVKESWIFFNEKTGKAYQHKVNQVPGYGPTIAGSFGDVAFKHFCKQG